MLDPFGESPPEPGKPPWLRAYRKRRADAISACAEIKNRAIENHKFAAPGEEQVPYSGGDSRGGRRAGGKSKFALMSINEVHPVLATMSGRQVMGRFERRYIPRREEVRRWAEPMSNWDRAVTDACHAPQEESMAFRNGPGIAGLSWIEVSVDYLEDPEGMLVEEEVPIWEMLWPAHEARKKNLLDRDWDIRGKWYPLPKFKALWPEKVKEVSSKVSQASEWDSEGDQGDTPRLPWERATGDRYQESSMPFLDKREGQIWVEHYEWREPGARFYVATPPDGMSYADADAMQAQQAAGGVEGESVFTVEEMSPEEFRAYSTLRAEQFQDEPQVPRSRYLKKERMVYRQAYLCGDVVLEEDEIPIGRWRREAMTGYPFTQPRRVDWRSVVDATRMPQIWTNIFLTMLVKYMQINPKGVLFVEKGVFKNRNDGLAQFSSAGGLVEFDRGKLSNSPNPPFRFESGGPSPMGGLVQSMLGFAQEMIPRSVGFNWAALGQMGPDLRRISGTVVEHVTDAMVASQAELYDSLALCRERIGLILLATLSRVLGMEHFRRVVGERAFLEEVRVPTPDPMTGQISMQPQIDPQTGEPMMQVIEPPEDLLDEAVWSVSVEETRSAPDRMRFFWESAMESGGLQTMKELGAIDAEGAVEIIPDMPEDMRERWLSRVKLKQRQMMQAPPE